MPESLKNRKFAETKTPLSDEKNSNRPPSPFPGRLCAVRAGNPRHRRDRGDPRRRQRHRHAGLERQRGLRHGILSPVRQPGADGHHRPERHRERRHVRIGRRPLEHRPFLGAETRPLRHRPQERRRRGTLLGTGGLRRPRVDGQLHRPGAGDADGGLQRPVFLFCEPRPCGAAPARPRAYPKRDGRGIMDAGERPRLGLPQRKRDLCGGRRHPGGIPVAVRQEQRDDGAGPLRPGPPRAGRQLPQGLRRCAEDGPGGERVQEENHFLGCPEDDCPGLCRALVLSRRLDPGRCPLPLLSPVHLLCPGA